MTTSRSTWPLLQAVAGCRSRPPCTAQSNGRSNAHRLGVGGDNSSPMKSTVVACMHMLAYVVAPVPYLYIVRCTCTKKWFTYVRLLESLAAPIYTACAASCSLYVALGREIPLANWSIVVVAGERWRRRLVVPAVALPRSFFRTGQARPNFLSTRALKCMFRYLRSTFV